jgi:hypothetical protein
VNSVVWVSEPLVPLVRERLASPRLGVTNVQITTSVTALVDAANAPDTFAVLDRTTIAAVGVATGDNVNFPVIAICDEPLQTAVGWLHPHPWICHVLGSAMLDHPYADEHLANVINTLGESKLRLLDWLGPTVVGRRVRLAHAAKRANRLDRMTDFFEANGVGARTVQQLRDAAEELLTNAFYDAPVSAGVMKPVSRTEDISLPDDSACDMAYGCREDLAIVRVRDPFGSLSRRRLVEVLTRCARTDMAVEVDESMGGAGLGMWRIFSGSTFVAIAVDKNRNTDILVGIAKRAAGGKRPFAFHLYFTESKRSWFRKKLDEDSSKRPPVNQSVIIVSKPK